MSMVLPMLDRGASKCWTECPILTPHHVDKQAKNYKLTFYGLEVLPCETIRNIGRIAGSEHPPRGQVGGKRPAGHTGSAEPRHGNSSTSSHHIPIVGSTNTEESTTSKRSQSLWLR